MKTFATLAMVGMLVASNACTFIARSTEDYKAVTRELVSTRNAEIRDCYDVALKTDAGVSGSVIVDFMVEKKSGTIINPSLNAGSTAPESLGQCVVSAIDGLTLDPPDQRDGKATFTWEFKADQATG